ncbi:MAG: lysophospholipid acyltransferase family protein [Cyanobacteria bacterium J06621_8]
MLSFTPRLCSQSLISTLRLDLTPLYAHRIPQEIPAIVISNHRSFLDAPILINTMPNTLRIACHHYMGQTPLIREVVTSLGCFPLAKAKNRQRQLFAQANSLLTSQQWVGLFPEGTKPMIEPTSPQEVNQFHRGFAHLAWQAPVEYLAVIPVAIASLAESTYPTIPIRWLQLFDRQEPFFARRGNHPMLVYHRVKVLIGQPYLINPSQKQLYKGRQAKQLAQDLTQYCQTQIIDLLQEGCY